MNDFKDIKVAVAGTGYVGLSIATLIQRQYNVKYHATIKMIRNCA